MTQPQAFMPISPQLMEVLAAIKNVGGRPLIVGGAVRDACFAREIGVGTFSKDIDVEVFGLSREALKQALSPFGVVNDVGESFAVIKLTVGDEDFDFSLPRRDNKSGRGHRGFEVEVDHTMTPREAAKRRDFTINALSFDPFTDEIIDPFGGLEDIRNRVLRPTSEHFAEDSLRILRGFQFVARFDLTWTDDLEEIGRQLRSEFVLLPQERIREEWLKWAKRGVKPSQGLKFLKAVGWLDFFPEVAALDGVPQDKSWHQEGDVFEHTCHVVDAMVWQCSRDGIVGERRAKLTFAALCHDLGKVTNTWLMPKSGEQGMATNSFHWSDVSDWTAEEVLAFQEERWDEEWRWRSPAHDQAGAEPTRAFMDRLFKASGQNRSSAFVDGVVALVVTHMRHVGLALTDRAVRRLSRDVPLLDMQQVVNADTNGRPFVPETWRADPSMSAIVAKADELAVRDEQPQPLLMGRHLIELGLNPSVLFGQLIADSFEAQLDGEFSTVEGAKAWAEGRVQDGI